MLSHSISGPPLMDAPTQGGLKEDDVKIFGGVVGSGAVFAAITAANAADVDNGRRQAELRCATCHVVAPNQRDEIADSPPFEVIARKFSANPDMLIYAIL